MVDPPATYILVSYPDISCSSDGPEEKHHHQTDITWILYHQLTLYYTPGLKFQVLIYCVNC